MIFLIIFYIIPAVVTLATGIFMYTKDIGPTEDGFCYECACVIAFAPSLNIVAFCLSLQVIKENQDKLPRFSRASDDLNETKERK